MQIITKILKNSDYWSIITLGRHPILWIQRVGHGEPSARLSCLNTFLWYLLHRQVPSFQFAVSRGKMNKAILNWNLHEENVAIWRIKFIYSFLSVVQLNTNTRLYWPINYKLNYPFEGPLDSMKLCIWT